MSREESKSRAPLPQRSTESRGAHLPSFPGGEPEPLGIRRAPQTMHPAGCVALAWITEGALRGEAIGFPDSRGSSLETADPASSPQSTLQWRRKLLNSRKATENTSLCRIQTSGNLKKKKKNSIINHQTTLRKVGLWEGGLEEHIVLHKHPAFLD